MSLSDWVTARYERVLLKTVCGCTREITATEDQIRSRRIVIPFGDVRFHRGHVEPRQVRPIHTTREFQCHGERQDGLLVFREVYDDPRFTEEDVRYWENKYKRLYSQFYIDEGL